MKRISWIALLIIASSIFLVETPSALASSERAFATVTVNVVPKLEKQLEKYAALYANASKNLSNAQYKQKLESISGNSKEEDEVTLIISETL